MDNHAYIYTMNTCMYIIVATYFDSEIEVCNVFAAITKSNKGRLFYIGIDKWIYGKSGNGWRDDLLID